MLLNTDEFENARQICDPRFDGQFFVGVLTTGVYCRPICPVRVPKKENVQLYKSAAAAAEAGFRPCLRCRFESSPGTPAWIGSSWKVSRALQLIDETRLNLSEICFAAGFGSLRRLNSLFSKTYNRSPRQLREKEV